MLQAWLELLTVWGDPLSGFIIAALVVASDAKPGGIEVWRIIPAIFASLCLYSAGQAGERFTGGRPTVALVWAGMLAAVGIGLATLAGGATGMMLAGGLAFCQAICKASLNSLAFARPIFAGAGRGLSVLIGSSVAGMQALNNPWLMGFVAGITIYSAGIATVAWRAGRPGQLGAIRFLPPLAMLLWVPAIAWAVLPIMIDNVTPLVLIFITLAHVIKYAKLLAGRPVWIVIQQALAGWTRCLILVQLAVITILPPPALLSMRWPIAGAIAMLGCWIISAWLGRRSLATAGPGLAG
jgi:hypothetical protein